MRLRRGNMLSRRLLLLAALLLSLPVFGCSEAPSRSGRGGSGGGGSDTSVIADSSSGDDSSSESDADAAGDSGSGGDTTADGSGSGEACTSDCEPGLPLRCASSTAVEQCAEQSDGCFRWEVGENCADGFLCLGGACAPDCSDECANPGVGECDGGGVRLCGNFDSDGCLEFSATESCPSGTSCSLGVCSTDCTDECSTVGERSCSGDRIVECGQADGDACLDLATVELCALGQRCTAGVCETPNVAPVAMAGLDLGAETDNPTPLDGSASYDPDGGVLFYAWMVEAAPAGATATILPVDGPRPLFRASLPGTYLVVLTVTDAGGLSASDSLQVEVTRSVVNQPPVADAGADRTVDASTLVLLDGSASADPEGGPLTYRWSVVSQPVSSILSLTCTTATCPVTVVVPGTYQFRITVNDSGGLVAFDEVTITVSSPPCLLFSEYVDGTGNNKAYELYNCGTSAFDMADAAVCLFTNGSLVCGTLGAFSGSLAPGDVFSVCNSASDGVVVPASRCDAYSPTTNFNGDDRLLVFDDSARDRRFDAGDRVFDAIGPVDAPLSPPLDGTASLQRCNLTPAVLSGSWAVADWFLPNALPNDFSGLGVPPSAVACAAMNLPPVVATGVLLDAFVGDLVTLDASLSYDPDGDPLTFTWTAVSAPIGVSLPSLGGVGALATFTPLAAGIYEFSVTVSDGRGGSTTQPVTVSATVLNLAPVAYASGPSVAAPSTTIYLDGSSSYDPNGDLLSYRWSFDGLPSGSFAFFSSETSLFPTFYADVAGTYLVRLTVTDPGGLSSTDIISISVQTLSSCLRISEYLEGTSLNKAVEVHNCEAAETPLSGVYLCVVTNSAMTCSSSIPLSGAVAAGGTYVLCNSSLTLGLGAFCDQSTGALNFNGDDRLVLYRDADTTGTFTSGDEVLDAFGETAVVPPDALTWANVTYRRCNSSSYSGAGSFVVSAYFASAATDDYSGLGISPDYAGCP